MNSVSVKIIALVILALLLQIPSFKIQGLIRERENRRDTAVVETNKQWGAAQTVEGPIVAIPYKVFTTEEKTVDAKKETRTIEQRKIAYFLPKDLKIKTKAETTERKRGIYKVALYGTEADLSGSFLFNFNKLSIPLEGCFI